MHNCIIHRVGIIPLEVLLNHFDRQKGGSIIHSHRDILLILHALHAWQRNILTVEVANVFLCCNLFYCFEFLYRVLISFDNHGHVQNFDQTSTLCLFDPAQG